MLMEKTLTKKSKKRKKKGENSCGAVTTVKKRGLKKAHISLSLGVRIG